MSGPSRSTLTIRSHAGCWTRSSRRAARRPSASRRPLWGGIEDDEGSLGVGSRESFGEFNYVVYSALMRMYSGERSQVQMWARARPAPRWTATSTSAA